MEICFNINGRLLTANNPLVMAIINATDDSFFSASRCTSEEAVLQKAELALSSGADILDIGGCSTRPSSTPVDQETEWQRVRMALTAIRSKYPDATLSLDTFRAEVAQRAISEFGGMIINDISGWADEKMQQVVTENGVPYVLTYCTPSDNSGEQYLVEMIDVLQRQVDRLQQAGAKDIIIDPGFGFGKTLDQNWHILSNMHCLQILGKPILAGISRKSMIQKILDCNAAEALNGTTAAHMIALEQGADILRVHDVKEAKQTLLIYAAAKR